MSSKKATYQCFRFYKKKNYNISVSFKLWPFFYNCKFMKTLLFEKPIQRVKFSRLVCILIEMPSASTYKMK